MTAQSTPTAASSPADRPDDLFTLTLLDGLPAMLGDKEIRYKVVKLRETTVADERKAEREAERCVQVNGAWRLVVSDSTFKHVLNMLHIESLTCDDTVLSGHLIDLDLYDRLSSRDLSRIEERIFLVSLAAEVRYGNMTQAEFEAICDGLAPATSPQPPQPSGQASDVGALADQSGSGPAMLADFAGKHTQGAAEGNGHPNRQADR
jgi:phage FluMu protein gp41